MHYYTNPSFSTKTVLQDYNTARGVHCLTLRIVTVSFAKKDTPQTWPLGLCFVCPLSTPVHLGVKVWHNWHWLLGLTHNLVGSLCCMCGSSLALAIGVNAQPSWVFVLDVRPHNRKHIIFVAKLHAGPFQGAYGANMPYWATHFLQTRPCGQT